MPRPQRRWDLIEIHAENGISSALIALGLFSLAGVLFAYRGEGTFFPLSIILTIIGLVFFGMAINKAVEIRKIDNFAVQCSFCEEINELISEPEQDFLCIHCNRMIPIKDGKPLAVQQ